MPARMNWSLQLLVSLCLCQLVGCGDGGGPKFPVVRVDPDAVAANVIAEFDKNGDGEVSPSELKKSKGLMMLTAGEQGLLQEFRLDSDGSGSVSEAEFARKFADCFKDLRQGYSCQVNYRGKPLEGATVTLVPEAFMGEDIPTASGTTDYDGNCVGVSTPDGIDGAVPGIYKIEITHPEEKIASKYNTETTLSVALDPTNPYATHGVPKHNLR